MLASRSSAATTFVALAVAGVLAACGNAPAGGGSRPASAPASPAPRILAVTVHLAAGFSPSSLRLRTGQQFLVVVNEDVRVSGLPGLDSCARGTTQLVAAGLLSVRCTARGYRYTALHPGHGELSAIVRPRCAPGAACPQWIAAPVLKITFEAASHHRAPSRSGPPPQSVAGHEVCAQNRQLRHGTSSQG